MDCLITRLKEVVSNENLERFDLITVGLPVEEIMRRLAERFSRWPKLYLKCLNDTVIQSREETYTEVNGEALVNPRVILHDNVPGSVDWDFLRSEMISGAFNISDIYSESIIGIDALRNTTAGDVKGVNSAYGTTKDIDIRFPNLQVFICQYVPADFIYGNITDFSNATSLFEILLRTTPGIVGDLKDLADGQIAAGRTSGTLRVLANGIITNNGSSIEDNTWMDIVFSNGTYTISQES